MQIQRYERGQKYEPHFDYFNVKINHRYATVLMYLSTVDKGGETVFPNAKVPTDSISMFLRCLSTRSALFIN
jgi:Rps23 Pro-64 3,4-dihydroxylase Tpa1-like proline 4-hydroxylase